MGRNWDVDTIGHTSRYPYVNDDSGGSGCGCGGKLTKAILLIAFVAVLQIALGEKNNQQPYQPSPPTSSYNRSPIRATIEEPTVQVQHIKHDTGLEFSLDGIDFDADAVNTHFFVKNLSGKSQNFEIAPSLNYFKLVDNIGREWPATKIPHIVTKLDNGEKSVDIGPRFDNTLLRDDAVTFVVLTVKNLKGVNEASWKIKINR